MAEYYDWDKLCSFLSTADTALILGGRGIGKTFGYRLKVLSAFESDRQERSVELCRFAKEVPDVITGYFDKLQEKGYAGNYKFTVKNNNILASTLDAVHGAKLTNELIVYGVGLTQQQSMKKRTFSNVRYIGMDEAILDRCDRYHRYLPDEYLTLVNMVSTILREEPGHKTRGKLILMGNALDLINPYFEALQINEVPSYGYSWHKSKSVILHYVPPIQAQERKDSMVGRMLAGYEDESKRVFDNVFAESSNEFIGQKSRNAQFSYAVRFEGKTYAVWIDFHEGYVYVNSKVPANHESKVLAMTTADNRIDYEMVRKTHERLKSLQEMYLSGIVRFDTPAIRENFRHVLTYLGIK